MSEVVRRWHEVVDAAPSERVGLLDALLADEVVFRSPAVHTPQEGKLVTTAYLLAAMTVLGPVMHYEREIVGEDSAALEFHGVLDGKTLQGIDLIRWDADGRIVDFTVLVRPLQGLQQLIARMGAELSRLSR